jgi:general secretion pathway protein C
MKRLPVVGSVLALALLSVSAAYWGLQLFKPPQRAIAAPPPPPPVAINIEAAKGLFGGQITVAAVSNYQLKGVVASGGSGSAAILAVDNKPSMAYGVGREVVSGVTVKEVHPKYVLLSEGGAIKRIDLPNDASASSAGIMSMAGNPGNLGNPGSSGSPMLPPVQTPPPVQPPVQPNSGNQPNQFNQPNPNNQQQMMQRAPSMQPQPAMQEQPPTDRGAPSTSPNQPQRSSASPTTIAPVPGFDRQQ